MLQLAVGKHPWSTAAADPATLKTLAGRTVTVEKDRVVATNETQAIEAYRKFLEVAPKAPQRAQAMRRIGDLETQNKVLDDRATALTNNIAALSARVSDQFFAGRP